MAIQEKKVNVSQYPRHTVVAIIFLIFCMLITAWVYIYWISVDRKIKGYEVELAETNKAIEALRSDENVQAFELYTINKPMLEDLTYKSNVPTFYTELARLSRIYDFSFSNFSYREWELSLSAIAQTTWREQAYGKLRDVIEAFRLKPITNSNQDEVESLENENQTATEFMKESDSIFSLNEVQAFQWSANIETTLNFTIKPEVVEEEVEEETDSSEESEEANDSSASSGSLNTQ